MSGDIEELTRDRIPEWITGSDGPVFVDVWGPRCEPCLRLAPMYADLADKYRDRARFLKLEAPKNRMACVDLTVMTLPTFLLFLDGEEKSRISGESLTDRELGEWVVSWLDEPVATGGVLG